MNGSRITHFERPLRKGWFFYDHTFLCEFPVEGITYKTGNILWGGNSFPVLFVVILVGQFWKQK